LSLCRAVVAQMIKQVVLVVLALALGGLLAYVDSRPNWDDTGVLVGILLIASMAFGFMGPRRPWLWALALGLWIPLVGWIRTHSAAPLVALVVAFVGAYLGMAAHRATQSGKN